MDVFYGCPLVQNARFLLPSGQRHWTSHDQFFQDLGTSTKFDVLITFWPAPLDLSIFLQDSGTCINFQVFTTFWPAPLDLSCPFFFKIQALAQNSRFLLPSGQPHWTCHVQFFQDLGPCTKCQVFTTYYLLARAAGPLMSNFFNIQALVLNARFLLPSGQGRWTSHGQFFQDLGTSTKFDILITFWPAPLDLPCPFFSRFRHL